MGKTRTALVYSYILALKGYRVVNFYRTIGEIEHALEILREIKSNIPSDLIISPLVGKEHLCMFLPEDRGILKWWCTILSCYFLKKRKSPEFEEKIRQAVETKIRKYYELAKDMDLCPYFAYQEIAKKSNLILTVHNYFIDSRQFEKLGKIDLAIIDEAHNIFIIKTKEIEEDVFKKGREIERLFKKENERDDFIAKKLWLEGSKGMAISYSNYVEYKESEGIELEFSGKKIKILPPKSLYKKRLGEIGKIILLSGSLYPINLYNKIFGVDEFESESIIVKGLIEGKGNRKVYGLITGLSTRKRDRTRKTLNDYANIIRRINLALERPLFVFTPNKTIANELSKNLGGIYIERVADNLVYINEEECRETIYFSHARGILSEGVDLNLGTCVPEILIIVGLPYPNIELETREILYTYEKYYHLPRGSLVDAYRKSEMFSALIQAIGRVGRREKGVAIIIDDRIEKMNLGIRYLRSLKQLIKEIETFLGKR